MLRGYLSTVHTLVGYFSTIPAVRVLYSVDAYKSTTNKLSCRRSTSRAGSHAKHRAPNEITQVGRDLTSTHIPDHLAPSHADKARSVNNVSQPEVAQSGPFVQAVSAAHLPRTYLEPGHPVDVLFRFLSGESTKSDNPQTYDAEALSSHFVSLRTAGLLKRLGQVHLSSLISIFGTLSISPARNYIYKNSLASHIKCNSRRTYWSFIAHIAMEKESMGWGLTLSDHYWLMRADLAIVNSPGRDTSLGSDTRKRHDAMFRALREYHFIRRHSIDPEVHGPYLEALLCLQTPRHLRRAAEALCELLSRSNALQHPRLLMVLWQVVLRSGFSLSHESKEDLLTLTVKRLLKRARRLPETGITNNAEAIAKGSIPEIYASGIIGLADTLTSVIFSPFPSSKDGSNVVTYQWALSEARAVFAPHKPFAQRWNSLVLLALSNTATVGDIAKPGTTIQGKQHHYKVPHADWDVICVLATIQKSFDSTSPPRRSNRPLKQDVGAVCQTLWAKWREGHANRPKGVSRVVAISFFRMAAIGTDATLTAAVDQHCISFGLWNIGDIAEAAQVACLATEYIWASFNCGMDSVNHVVAELHDSFQRTHWQSMISHIFSNLSRRDIRLASELYSVVRGTADLPIDTMHSLAMSLASEGLVNVTLPFFREPRLSESKIRELLDAVLFALAKGQHAILHPDVATVVSDVMHSSYATSPPAPMQRMIIQHILLALAASSHAAKAAAIFEIIHGASPTFFARAFILRFLPVLTRYRQFYFVTRILKALTKSHPQQMGAFRKVCVLCLVRGGAIRHAIRANSVTWGWRNRDVMVRMAHWVRFRIRTPPSELSLKLSSTMEKYTSDGPATLFAMRILVRGGRILAAKQLFLRTREFLDPPVRTSLGNIMLDGYARQLRTHNGRHMRKVLLAYDSLIQEGDLVPDRVTVNTMLKAILHWRKVMDSVKLRVLFDNIVRNGYAGRTCHDHVPFGTSISVHQGFQLPQLDTPMSFERHVRPVLKMFIKAFHVRSDVAAARQVIAILKSAEEAILEKRDHRRRARKAGKKWTS